MAGNTDFERALHFTFDNEGGSSNHPADRGGATNMGITASTLARAYEQELVRCRDVSRLKRDEAAIIYKAYYWQPSYADQMPWPLCALHFDAAVNHGLGGAARLLQRALNLYGAGLTVDGAIGPRTLKALDHILKSVCVIGSDQKRFAMPIWISAKNFSCA